MCVGTQSKSIRYENSEGDEIGVKFNRNNDIIIIIEKKAGASYSFLFSKEDDQTLNYFENILTNVVSYYNTFDMNYGRKINESNKGMAFKVIGEGGSYLEIGVNSEIGVRFEIQNSGDHKCVNFTFTREDKTVLEMFKTDLGNIIRKNVSKLPPVVINASSRAEIHHSLKDGE